MIIDQIYKKGGDKKDTFRTNDSPTRSFVKALSWRAFGTLDTVLISWLISGRWDIAFSIGTFELLTKTILYYFHERLWNVIKWGR